MLLFDGAMPLPEKPFALPETGGPLAEYVQPADAHYGWQMRRSSSRLSGRFAELILTSQRWQNALWRHQLFVYRPAEIRDAARAILIISNGQWSDEFLQPPGENEAALDLEMAPYADCADRLGVVIAVLRQVPAQPLFEEKLVEDAAVAHTFQKFLDTADLSWPLLLPMVKSAVRAMDAVGDYSVQQGYSAPTKFTISGASKRGWTSWLTAAVDSRIVALAPQVIDLLDIPRHMVLQLQSWGQFSEMLNDYTERNLQLQLLSPTGQLLLQTVDPIHYRQRIQQPKFLMLATNDRYWPLEALNLYWNELPGEKYVTYFPNCGHDLNDPERMLGAIAAVSRHAAGDLTLPQISWDYVTDKEGVELIFRSDRRPLHAKVWTAVAPTRDFRDAQWSPTQLSMTTGEYRYRLAMPSDGFAAVLGEMKFDDPVMPYYLSTTVRVVPDLDLAG